MLDELSQSAHTRKLPERAKGEWQYKRQTRCKSDRSGIMAGMSSGPGGLARLSRPASAGEPIRAGERMLPSPSGSAQGDASRR